MTEAARILAARDRILRALPTVELVGNAAAVVRHAVRPTVGADTTGRPAASEYVAALDALRSAR